MQTKLEINGHFIKHIRTPINRADTATKDFVDRPQYNIATRITCLNNNTGHTLFIFPHGKSFARGKLIDQLFVVCCFME